MSDREIQSSLSLYTPAHYDITIVGHIDKSWSAQVGMAMDHTTCKDGTAVTILTGQLIDQAALFGVLNGLYGLGFPLLSVECKSLVSCGGEL